MKRILVSLLAVALTPPARNALAEWLGIPIGIKHVKTLPTPSPRPSTSDTGQRLELGGLDHRFVRVAAKALMDDDAIPRGEAPRPRT